MSGFNPTERILKPEFEKDITNEVTYGNTDSGIPARQERMNFNVFNQDKVYATENLDEFLKSKNPNLNQLRFIGTNLYNEYDYELPQQTIESLEEIPNFGVPNPPVFGESTLHPDPFDWKDPLVFVDDRFGISSDFNQKDTFSATNKITKK